MTQRICSSSLSKVLQAADMHPLPQQTETSPRTCDVHIMAAAAHRGCCHRLAIPATKSFATVVMEWQEVSCGIPKP